MNTIAVPTAFYDNEDLNTKQLCSISGISMTRCEIGHGMRHTEQHSPTLVMKLQLLKKHDAATFLPDDLEIIFGVASIRQKEALQLAEKVNASAKINGVLLGFSPHILPSQKKRGSMWKLSPKRY